MDFPYSLVIPTNNRPQFVERFLSYYYGAGFRGELVIVDGSDDANVDANLDIIERYRAKGMAIQHTISRDPIPFVSDAYKWPAGFGGRLARGLDLVRSPCVQMMCDDDFATMEYMDAASSFLIENRDYCLVMGRVASIYLDNGASAYGKIVDTACTNPIPPRPEPNAAARLLRAERMPYPNPVVMPQTILAMTTTEQWKRAMATYESMCRALPKAGRDVDASVDATTFILYYVIDVIHAYTCLAAGKMHSLPNVMAARHFHQSNEGGGGRSVYGTTGRQSYIVEALLSEQWPHLVNAALEPVVDEVAAADGIAEDTARAIVRSCFTRNFMPTLEHVVSHRLLALSGEPAPKTPWSGRLRRLLALLLKRPELRAPHGASYFETAEMRRLVAAFTKPAQ